jgi:hypothetical protein
MPQRVEPQINRNEGMINIKEKLGGGGITERKTAHKERKLLNSQWGGKNKTP